MSKICVLGDLHFGARNDSAQFLTYFRKFFDDILIPYLLENGIKIIIQLGDIFDRRKVININTLDISKECLFDVLLKHGIEMITLVGNHDTYFKNTNEVNSQKSLLSDYKNIKVCDTFSTINIEGIDLDIIPWICESNEEETVSRIRESKSQICFAHLELNGFQVNKGNVFSGSHFDNDVLKKYDKVITGHFHHKSDNGHVFYLGTPYEITWNDFSDPKGFHIFDITTRELEFIGNPYRMFKKIIYDDIDITTFNYDEYKESNVKVMVLSKSDPVVFDTFIENLEKSGTYRIKIIEDFDSEVEDEEIDEGEDTLTILSKVIDSSILDVDPDRLKVIMKEIYIEALDYGKGE